MTSIIPDEYLTQKPLHRSLAMDDVKIDDGDVFTVSGRLVPYGVKKAIGPNVTERFSPGAFKRAANAPSRIKFFGVSGGDGHQGQPVGHGLVIEDREDGPWGTFKIVDTAAGIDTQKLLRADDAGNATLDELSIVFTTLPNQFTVTREGRNLHVEHRSARLLGVAPVAAGAYGRDALVVQARSLDAARRMEVLARLRSLTS